MNAQLIGDHGLTLSDFEVLLRLADAPDRRMRRVDLADQVLLTASGITRLLDGLERSALVARDSCPSDRRVVYAVLTDAGHQKLKEAAASHFLQIDELLGTRFDREELAQLASLLSRLAEPRDEIPCEPAA